VLNAINSEIGPILPKYIVIITIILPHIFIVEISPLLKPTVVDALTASYITLKVSAFVTIDKTIIDISVMASDRLITAAALFTAFCGIALLNIEASSLFLMVATADAINTAIVTVLIPPAVPTGEPPMNINSNDKIAVESVKFCCGIVQNPADLVVTD
jgi:hypothetical protein